MRQLAIQAKERVATGDLDSLGLLLHETWELKKTLARRISNGRIDEIYDAARRAGATGGKITGAGGGGFLLVYCPEGSQENVRSALSGLQELPFSLEQDGSKVIFNYQP